MKHPEVFLDGEHRMIACREMARSLLRHGAEVIDLCVSAAHYHILARHYVGIAKKDSARALSDAGLAAPGGVWTARGSIKPIKQRRQQLRVVRYIRGHASHDAVVRSRIGVEEGLAAS